MSQSHVENPERGKLYRARYIGGRDTIGAAGCLYKLPEHHYPLDERVKHGMVVMFLNQLWDPVERWTWSQVLVGETVGWFATNAWVFLPVSLDREQD